MVLFFKKKIFLKLNNTSLSRPLNPYVIVNNGLICLKILTFFYHRHREYYKSKKCIMHCDKNEIPVAELYKIIEEHVVLKEKLRSIEVYSNNFYL